MNANDPHDMEALAEVEHNSWAKWTDWMLSQIEAWLVPDTLPSGFAKDYCEIGLRLFRKLSCVGRWRRQMSTPYAELSEKEKESDRKVVREKLALYRPKGSINDNDAKVLENLRTCLSVTIAAGGQVSSVMLNELVKTCGLELEKV